jgi:hypothetical protein
MAGIDGVGAVGFRRSIGVEAAQISIRRWVQQGLVVLVRHRVIAEGWDCERQHQSENAAFLEVDSNGSKSRGGSVVRVQGETLAYQTLPKCA